MEVVAAIAISFLFWCVIFHFVIGRERLVRFLRMLRGKDHEA